LSDPNHGLLFGDVDKNKPPCVVNAFTKPNSGRDEVTVTLPGSSTHVPALTALKLWVQFAVRTPNGALTSQQVAGGVSASEIAKGRNLFSAQKCTTCHRGEQWTIGIRDFTPPPPFGRIACEVDLGAAAPPGSHCTTAPKFGNPIGAQYIADFLRDVGSFNLGVPGQGNNIGKNIGASEVATQALVGGVAGAFPDALGRDYNGDGLGNGFNVSSLLGVHATQPYMHNGACETLACVVSDKDHRTAKGTLPDKLASPAQQRLVVKFLESIDFETKFFKQ
jgi:hypothetical protein